MPGHFALETLSPQGEWVLHGIFAADMFDRGDDGSYVCTGHGGSPLYLRCLRQNGSVVYVLDGGGDPFTYRLVPVDREDV